MNEQSVLESTQLGTLCRQSCVQGSAMRQTEPTHALLCAYDSVRGNRVSVRKRTATGQQRLTATEA